MENSRTNAQSQDDSTLIDDTVPAPAQQGSSGGALAEDVASQAEVDMIEDPDGRTRVRKADDIANGEAERQERPRGA